MSSTIILSRPLGPNELLTTFAMACVARTAADKKVSHAASNFRIPCLSGGDLLTILIADVGARNLLAAEEQRAVPGLSKH